MALTEVQIKRAKPESRAYKLPDGLGLACEIRPTGKKVFLKNYRFAGKPKTETIGEYPEVSLSHARARALDINQILKDGGNPADTARGSRRAPAAEPEPEAIPEERLFENVADLFIEKRIREGIASATIDKLNWNMGFCKDHFRGRDIAAIKPPEILSLVEKVQADGLLDKAKDVHRKLGQLFDYAIGRGLVEWNPAHMINRAVVKAKGGKHPGLTNPKDVGGLIRAIRGYNKVVTRAALSLSAMCILRSGELRLARRQEIDLDKAQWVVPADRMKGHYGEHIVPLSHQAVTVASGLIEWLGIADEPEAFLFPSLTHKDRAISENTLNAALRRLGYDTRREHCHHGFRTTFSTNMNEQGWNRDWIERQLCHVDRDEVRSAYNKALYLEGRTEMMQAYSDWLDQVAQDQ